MIITPTSVTLRWRDSTLFQCDTASVTWSLAPGCGHITPGKNGACTYRAPLLLLSRTVALTAQDQNTSDSASAMITISSVPFWMGALSIFWAALFGLLVWGIFAVWPPPVEPPWVEVYPPSVALPLGGTTQFSAHVWNAPDREVIWSAPDGLISPTGLFTAPATGSTVIVTASRKSDKTQAGTALVQLTPKNQAGLSLAPAYIELGPSQTTDIIPIRGSATVAKWFCSSPPNFKCDTDPFEAGKFTFKGQEPDGEPRRFVITAEGAPANAAAQPASDKPPANAARGSTGTTSGASSSTSATPARTLRASAVVYVLPKDSAGPASIAKQLHKDKQLLWLVLFMGALGAVLGASRSFVHYVGNRQFACSWSFYYLSRPALGAGLALLVFFAYRIGALTAPGNYSSADPAAAAFIAGMVGLFVDSVLGKLHELIAVLIPSREPRKDPLTRGVPVTPIALAIAAVAGSMKDQTITITGTGFTQQTRVTVGGHPRTPALTLPTRIVLPLEPGEVVGSQLNVTVTDGTAAASATGTIT